MKLKLWCLLFGCMLVDDIRGDDDVTGNVKQDEEEEDTDVPDDQTSDMNEMDENFEDMNFGDYEQNVPETYADKFMAVMQRKEYKDALDRLKTQFGNKTKDEVLDEVASQVETMMTVASNDLPVEFDNLRLTYLLSIEKTVNLSVPSAVSVVFTWDGPGVFTSLGKLFWKVVGLPDILEGNAHPEDTDEYYPPTCLLNYGKQNFTVQDAVKKCVTDASDAGIFDATEAAVLLPLFSNWMHKVEWRQCTNNEINKSTMGTFRGWPWSPSSLLTAALSVKAITDNVKVEFVHLPPDEPEIEKLVPVIYKSSEKKKSFNDRNELIQLLKTLLTETDSFLNEHKDEYEGAEEDEFNLSALDEDLQILQAADEYKDIYDLLQNDPKKVFTTTTGSKDEL
eukprot:GHVR01166277.1.p1 GENE.GHVR01166277.1~~GHVR01166277.1.p1  ORF type:complete len:394 (+),score=102.51 GHVR01166277.1:69-1250(+)